MNLSLLNTSNWLVMNVKEIENLKIIDKKNATDEAELRFNDEEAAP
jgi:hypothetical protein